MFFLLLSPALGDFSPKKVPPPVPNAVLKYFGLILRHGHIAPLHLVTNRSTNGVWTCDSDDSESSRMHTSYDNGFRRRYQRTMDPRFMAYPPNCELADLTIKGMKHISSLGAYFREYLIDNMSFLPNDLDTSLLSVRVNRYDRAVRTAVSFLNTFYPPMVPDVEQIKIIAGTVKKDVLNAGSRNCQEANKAMDQFKKSQQYADRMDQSIQIQSSVLSQIGMSNSNVLSELGDWMQSFIDNGGLPINATEDQIKRARDDIAFNLFEFANYSKYVGASPILRLLFKDLEISLSKNSKSKKFNLYVMDSQQIATLAALIGNPEYDILKFGAHLSFEVWRENNGEDVVRFVYNGEPLTLKYFDVTTMPLSKYKMELANKNHLSGCLADFP